MNRAVLLLALGACADPTTTDDAAPSGELAAQGERVWVADADRASVWTQLVGAGLDDEVALGAPPTRMVRVGDDLYVTLQTTGELVHLRQRRSGLEERDRVYVGSDPFDVVAHDHALYVSLPADRQVVVLRPNLERAATYDLDGTPAWMHASAEADAVFVMVNEPAAVVALGRGEPRWLPLPEVPRFERSQCTQRLLDTRITGTPVVVDETLFVPTVLVDTELEEPAENIEQGCVPRPRGDEPTYAGTPTDIEILGRSTAALARLDLDGDDVTYAMPTLGSAVLRNPIGDLRTVRRADGAPELLLTVPTLERLLWVRPNHCRISGRFHLCSGEDERADLGIQSVQVHDDRLVTSWSPVDRRLRIATQAGRSAERWPDAPDSPLSSEVRWGRKLFHDSNDRAMTTRGSGMVCASCHPAGGSDGRTWRHADFPRQTPSLLGGLTDTAPFTWTGDVATVAEEASLTAHERLGGTGLIVGASSAIEAYLDSLPQVRPADRDPGLVALGEALFHDARVGCAACHSGDKGTDGLTHQVFDYAMATATPPLAGVRATAPYLHDGSAATLWDVLERARDGSMGDTSGLDEHQLAALVAYIEAW
jgi:mono/diheme cytochrome c family protein